MKKIYFLFLLCSTISFAQTVTITKIVETQCQSQARLIELYVDGTVNLGSFDLNIVNGDFSAWNNIGFGNLNQVTMTDQFFYVVRSTSESDVAAEFPNLTLSYDKESGGFNAFAVSGSTNGDK